MRGLPFVRGVSFVLLVVAALIPAACESPGGVHDHVHEHGYLHEHGHEHDHEPAGDDHDAATTASAPAGGHMHWISGPDEPCSCPTARRVNGWCGACGVGYVAGTPVRSAMLHEAMDAHGHDIDAASMACASCREAEREDAFCGSCRWGFHGGKLYVSRLTWSLAHGAAGGEPGACAACHRHATVGAGWCDACGVGWVGTVRFDEREMYDIATTEHDRLRRAMALSERCELCGTAMFMGSRCPECGIDYTR